MNHTLTSKEVKIQINFTINIDDRIIAKIRKFFTKRNNIAFVFIGIIATTAIVYGAAFEKQWNFADGDLIEAAKINKNFDDLFGAVNELGQTAFTRTYNSTSNVDTIPSLSTYYLHFNTDVYDNDNMHDNSSNSVNSTLQANVDGVYLIIANFAIEAGSGSYRECYIEQSGGTKIASGTQFIAPGATGMPLTTINMSTIVYLSSGEYVRVAVKHDSSPSLKIDNNYCKPLFMMTRLDHQ